MGYDMVLTARDPHPKVGAQHMVPSLLRVGEHEAQKVRGLPILLSIIQLGSMTFLHFQGFFWFSKILLKGDLRKEK
jgi:hypothetical protein